MQAAMNQIPGVPTVSVKMSPVPTSNKFRIWIFRTTSRSPTTSTLQLSVSLTTNNPKINAVPRTTRRAGLTNVPFVRKLIYPTRHSTRTSRPSTQMPKESMDSHSRRYREAEVVAGLRKM